jgi:hypothetical protein
MNDPTIRRAAAILRQCLTGGVSHQVAQARVRRFGYSLDDPALAAELARQDQEKRAKQEAAEGRRRRQDQKVNAYIRSEYERVRGLDIADGL